MRVLYVFKTFDTSLWFAELVRRDSVPMVLHLDCEPVVLLQHQQHGYDIEWGKKILNVFGMLIAVLWEGNNIIQKQKAGRPCIRVQ